MKTTLHSIAEITKGTGISKDQLSQNGLPCILYGELYTKYKSEIISEIISRTELNSSSLVKSKANDVIIPSSGETAIDISTARCVPHNDILLGGDLNIIRLKNGDGRFLSYQLNGTRKLDIAKMAQGVSVVHLYGEKLKSLQVFIPEKAEQHKISSLLTLIDERISTQNKIIEKLESLIKGLSNHLFTECFIHEKLVILKSISILVNRKNDGKKNYPVMMISAEKGFINQSEKYSTDNAGNSLSKYTLLMKGELAYNRGSSKTKKYGSVFRLEHQNALIPYIYHSFAINDRISDALFYAYLLNSKLLDMELQKVISSTARMDGLLNISKEDFFSIKVPLPSIKKQQQISLALNKLREKITSEKDIFSAYQKQKEHLLRNMFI